MLKKCRRKCKHDEINGRLKRSQIEFLEVKNTMAEK